MGAGRHTQTFQVVASAGPSGGGAIGPPPQRNLGKTELGGVIFGCTHVTMNECLTKNLLGLPLQHIKYVQHIRPGMCLFMFNYSGRLLHGIYEAVSDGALNIDASAWTEGRGKTQFPAQVKVKIRQSCSPLSEAVFKEAIQDNYFAEGKFTNELTIPQRDHLLALFTRNMQAPTKSLSTYSGASVKGWKKVEDHVETIGAAKPSTGNAWGKVANTDDAKPSIGNAWGKKVEDHVENVGAAKPSIGNAWGKGANTDDAKPSIGNAWGKDANTDVAKPSIGNAWGKDANTDDAKPSIGNAWGKDANTDDAKPSIGNAWGKDANTDDAKPSIGNAWGKDANTDDARQRSVLEKLQRLDPSRASQEEQQPAEVEELPANTIVQSGQMRQDLPDIHRLMVELRACTDQQFQQQKTLEKLLVTNGILEQSQARTAAELAKVRLEMSELKSQLILCNTQGQEYRNNLLHISTSRSPVSEAQGVPKTLQDIYILGGLAETWLDSVVGFSPQSNQLKDVASLLAPRSYAASSILHGCIYIYGGGDGTSWSNSVERYNRDSNIWEPCPSMAVKRGSLGGVTLRDKIYAIGGGNGAVSFDDTECFDPIVGTWAATTKMIEKRFCVASAELDGAIYALGGFDGRDYLMSVERFDHREGLWKAVTPMSNQRGSLSAACLNGKLYALGGFNGRDFLNSVEIYDPRANTWTPGPSMISPRAYGVSAVVGDALYTLGGMEYMKQSFETSKMKIEKFTEAAGWEAVPLSNMINRNFAAAAVL